MNYKKSWIPTAVFILFSIGMILVLNLPQRVRETAGSSAEAAASTPDASPSAAVRLSASLYLDKEEISCIQAKDDASKKIIEEAIFDSMLQSTLYQGADLNKLVDKILIRIECVGESQPRQYVVYGKDDRHLIQAEGSTLAAALGDKAYKPLYELAMGYHLPYAVTAASGVNTVHAFGSAVSSEKKDDGVCADMRRYSPRQFTEHLEYLKIDASCSPPFKTYLGGPEVIGQYSLYDQDFNEEKPA